MKWCAFGVQRYFVPIYYCSFACCRISGMIYQIIKKTLNLHNILKCEDICIRILLYIREFHNMKAIQILPLQTLINMLAVQ